MSDNEDTLLDSDFLFDDEIPDDEEPLSDTRKAVGDESDNSDTPSDSVWEKRYKDVQAEMTRTKQALKDMEQRLADRGQPKDAPKSPLDDPEFLEQVRDDPAKAVQALKDFEKQMIELLEMRDAALESRFDPEVNALRERISALRKDPDLADFSDKQLSILIRKQMSKNGTVPQPRSLGGGTRVRQPQGRQTNPEDDPLFQVIYGDMFKEDK